MTSRLGRQRKFEREENAEVAKVQKIEKQKKALGYESYASLIFLKKKFIL